MRRFVPVLVLVAVVTASCGHREPSSPDRAFAALTDTIISDVLRRDPPFATTLGVHRFDAQVAPYTSASFHDEAAADQQFRTRLAAVDTTRLTLDQRLDRVWMMHTLEESILVDDTIRPWAQNPDVYSSGIANAAFVIMERNFAPAATRLAAIIDRERHAPEILEQARINLQNPPRIFTQIAIEQIDGDIGLFENALPEAFSAVTDSSLLRTFRGTNDTVIAELKSYRQWLQQNLLRRSHGDFALGRDVYARLLDAQEMIDVPVDSLLRIAEADRAKNESEFEAVAKTIDSTRSPDSVLARLQLDHPPADSLLVVTQATLDAIRAFIVDHHIVTIPPSDPARVVETPPFMRSTTTASMDTPGPFETAKLTAYYNMTLPDPRWSKADQDNYMRQWYRAAISNVTVHEVYPGHYIQFLYAPDFPTEARKVWTSSTNVEGWAHYCEQMMIAQGFHQDDPRYHLAQLQDALLRDVRFIAGIELHTAGMTIDSATRLFETEGHQPHTVAVEEAKRGAGDPLYGYYTMGKLMILRLRDDYRARAGSAYTLAGFHDAFLKLGPLPLPLMRRAMLGTDAGSLF